MSVSVRRIPVGVVVERRKAASPWAEFLWRPVAVLAGSPDAAVWTRLAEEGDAVSFYAGPAEILLYRSEADNYRCNLTSGAPAVWVMMNATDGEPFCIIGGVTVDPAEGEGWTEPGQAIVEAVAMPEIVREEIAAFVAQYPARPSFVRRRREPADPDALARRYPQPRRRDERR